MDDYTDILIDKINWMKDKGNVDFDLVYHLVHQSGLILTCGNGGSSATASHLTNDLVKMCGIQSVCLTDSAPLLTAYSNDVSYGDALTDYYQDIILARTRSQIEVHGRGVLVIIFSGSGNSQNVHRLAKSALRCGSLVIGVTGFTDVNSNTSDNMVADLCKLHGAGESVCFRLDYMRIDAAMQIAEDLGMIWSHLLIRRLVGSSKC